MANKAFEIQNSTLRIGGVDLQAGTTGVVIPGITQATNYFVEEVNERDGNNPDIFGNDPDVITVIDNAEYLYRSNDETPSVSYSAAGYSVQELDDGQIDEIYVEVDGTFLDSDRTLALAGNMWATTLSSPYTNFNPNDWTQIPYRPKMRAGEVENVGGGGTSTELEYIELTNNAFIIQPIVLGDSVEFARLANNSNTDFIDTGLTLARGSIQGLFNAETEGSYDNISHTSPAGTKWNSDGWGDLLNITTRSYGTLRSVLNNAIGNNILDAELIMHDTINDKYYKFDFTDWGENNGGSFAYTRTLIENPNFFKKDDYATGDAATDVFVEDDGDGAGVAITRGNNSGIYNPFRENGWNSNISPGGTLWNSDGWDDFSNLEARTYDTFDNTYGSGGLGNNVHRSKSVMYIPDTNEYYAIHWLSWTPNNVGGGFSYLRYKIDTTKINEGIKFADGSVLKSAEGFGSVKLRSPDRGKIEEAYGYNEVAVTAVNTINLTTMASRNGVNENRFWIDSSNTTIDDILNNTTAAGITDATSIQFSLDNTTWYTYAGGTSFNGNERGYSVTIPVQNLNYNIGDTIYFKYNTGGAPVVWWDKADLPGGRGHFRGAVIDYHAFTGESTIIGTIHIIDDNGEEHISHIEVQSGSSDGENDDLWYVTQEGQIQYRRIDGESKTLKIQWGAKVFYSSETYD